MKQSKAKAPPVAISPEKHRRPCLAQAPERAAAGGTGRGRKRVDLLPAGPLGRQFASPGGAACVNPIHGRALGPLVDGDSWTMLKGGSRPDVVVERRLVLGSGSGSLRWPLDPGHFSRAVWKPPRLQSKMIYTI